MKALILAAGKGTRLAAESPKCLLPVRGRPILEHILEALAAAGVGEAIIVTGFRGDLIRERFGDRFGDLKFTCRPAPDWELGNGASARAGEMHLLHEESFLLTMSDHLIAPALVQKVAAADLGSNLLAVGLDRDPASLFDLADGMKVKTGANGQVTSIAKDLPDYDGVDCGVFKTAPAFFATLAAAAAAGGHSFSHACARAASAGKMGTVDITGLPWHDLDTPASVAAANRCYFQRLGNK